MQLAAVATYWAIVAVWTAVLAAIAVAYWRNPRAFGTTRLLLAVLAVDTFRDIFENVYFGLYFGSKYGFFSDELGVVLGAPALLLVPKLLNVFAGGLVLGLLLWRWLPLAVHERSVVERSRAIAEEAARLKDHFIGTVSHELRTPLTAITASLALLEDSPDENLGEEAKELIGMARANSQRLHRLVNDILDIEKLEAGQVVFRPQRIEVDRLLRQEIETQAALAQSCGVTLRADIASGQAVEADPDRLRQVVSNLLSNAIKFSPHGAAVELRAETRGKHVRIAIRDHGPGIPPEFRARIFGKFAQADMSDSRPKTGTGLGLSIVKEIVARMSGEVGFADAPGGGTVFFVDLPPAGGARRVEAA
jgi:signal transduction histidine kinase